MTFSRLTAALADRYHVERELGAGGMATVYLAHDIKHDRDVAIKVLHPDLGAALCPQAVCANAAIRGVRQRRTWPFPNRAHGQLGIREPLQLRTHPLRGALFESWVASELVKQDAHCGVRRNLFHYRDAAGHEVDLVLASGSDVMLIGAKSGATIAGDFTQAVDRLAQGIRQRSPDARVTTRVVYGGTTRQTRGDTLILPWHEIDQVTWNDGSTAT